MINVTVSGTAVGVAVSSGIGPAGFINAPGTSTNAFGTFQLTAGNGITISTSVGQFQVASYSTTAVASFAPVQNVAGRTGNVVLQASDVTAGTFAIARIPTISYTALANVPATFNASAHTHSTTDVVSFTAAAAAAAPVQSVAGRSGAVSLAVADVSGLAAVASSGSYTSLANVPASFAPSAHTHSTADITGISSSFAAASHTHDAAAIASGVLELARIPTIGYTALSGVPATFAPQAHTHSTADVVGLTASFSPLGHTHDYAVTVHTHSTADITGYSALPAQGSKFGPLVTDGTAATWTTRYGVVDPVLVQGAGMTLTRDTSAGSITVAFAGGTSGLAVGSLAPLDLGVAAAGSSANASREDHVHKLPTVGDITAAAAIHTHDAAAIASGTINAARLPAGVSALNALTGGITIAGGANVTVSTASSTITIAAGGGGGTDSRFDLFLPPAPTSVSATAGNAQAVVSWTAPTGVLTQTPITDYAVRFQAGTGSLQTFSDAVSTATSTTVTGLTNGTAYTFRVAAVSGIGTGADSTASAAVTPTAVTPDPYFANVALLLPMNGTGATFIDSSGTPKSITVVNATQSTAASVFGGKSGYFSGGGSGGSYPRTSYISFPDLGIGTGDFAIELWLKTAETSNYRPIISNLNGGVGFCLFINYGGDGIISFQMGASQVVQSSGFDYSDNQWHYIAISRSGSTVRLYLNGTLASTGTSSGNLTSAIDTFVASDYYEMTGYIDDLRITVGSARTYTGGTIAVPSAAFPTS